MLVPGTVQRRLNRDIRVVVTTLPVTPVFFDQLESFFGVEVAGENHDSLSAGSRGTGEFEVVMTYASREEFDRSARQLEGAGFRVD